MIKSKKSLNLERFFDFFKSTEKSLEKILNHELKSLQAIPDNYPKYIITLDYDYVDYDGIKQINAIDFLLGKTEI